MSAATGMTLARRSRWSNSSTTGSVSPQSIHGLASRYSLTSARFARLVRRRRPDEPTTSHCLQSPLLVPFGRLRNALFGFCVPHAMQRGIHRKKGPPTLSGGEERRGESESAVPVLRSLQMLHPCISTVSVTKLGCGKFFKIFFGLHPQRLILSLVAARAQPPQTASLRSKFCSFDNRVEPSQPRSPRRLAGSAVGVEAAAVQGGQWV